VAKELDSTSARNAVYQDKTNILFSVGAYQADCCTLHLGSHNHVYYIVNIEDKSRKHASLSANI
jgi:hypothetical protein